MGMDYSGIIESLNTIKTYLNDLSTYANQLREPIDAQAETQEITTNLETLRARVEGGDTEAITAYRNAIEAAYGINLNNETDVGILTAYHSGLQRMAEYLVKTYFEGDIADIAKYINKL